MLLKKADFQKWFSDDNASFNCLFINMKLIQIKKKQDKGKASIKLWTR